MDKAHRPCVFSKIITTYALLVTCVIITARKRSLGQGNVSTPVCHLFTGEVGFPACITGHITRGGLPLGGLHPRGLADPSEIHGILWHMVNK